MAEKIHEFSQNQNPMDRDRTVKAAAKTKVYRGSWIVTIPMAAVAVAYVMLVFMPGRRAIGELHDRIEQKRIYIDQSGGLTAALHAAEEELQISTEYNTTWESGFPQQVGLSALYGQINALAMAAGVTTTRFDPEPVVLHDTTREIPLTVGCTGSFAQLFGLLHSLEELPMEVWVNSCKMENSGVSRGSVVCELNLVVFANNPNNSDYVRNSE